ncbi:MAG: alpha-ketoglutarate-dependent dioxygenase AlkB [Myxococcota bacterium]
MFIGSTSLTCMPLPGSPGLFVGPLREPWCPAAESAVFEAWWAERPVDEQSILMYGKSTVIPRRQRAYGRDYRFSGQTSKAADIPDWLAPVLTWAQQLEPRFDGLLLNWYDGALGERIGPHRDSIQGLVPETPIMTLSFGATRTFRMRGHPPAGQPAIDLQASHGHAIVIPWDTNRVYSHAVPHFKRDTGRRISITIRAFSPD